MPMLNSLVKVAAKPLPRIVSPEARAAVDYIVVGSFLAAADWFWRRNAPHWLPLSAAGWTWRSVC
jgi:hypothetical protein